MVLPTAGTPQAREEEGATILGKLKTGERLVALDERGRAIVDSRALSLGAALGLRFARGGARATVTEILAPEDEP